MKTILALDASSTTIGWCIYDGADVPHYGTITLPSPLLSQRLTLAETAIDQLVTRYQPSAAALERPAYGRTDAIVSQQRVAGVILLVLARWGLLEQEISPNTAKKALADDGRADKAAMIRAAAGRLIGATPYRIVTLKGSLVAVNATTGMVLYSEHTADALGIALAAYDKVQVEELEGVLV